MPMPKTVDPNRTFELFDDFFKLDTTTWTAVNDGGTGTNTCNATGGGEMSLVTAASDNDYHSIGSVGAFAFAAGKPLWFEARVSLTEANTDDANFLVGLSSVTDGTLLGDNGGGPPADYTGAVFFKVDGGTDIQFETSNSTTQTTNTAICPFTSGRTYRLGFHYDPRDDTTGRVYPWVYDETAGYLYATSKTAHDLSHPITVATTAVSAVMDVKAGGSKAETLKADYLRVIQAR